MFLYKSNFYWQSNAFLWFDFQTRGFTYQGEIASEQCSAALGLKAKKKKRKKKKKRGLCISAMSHVKLITETRVYICHKNMKFMAFFTVFRKFFAENVIKKYSTGRLSLR